MPNQPRAVQRGAPVEFRFDSTKQERATHLHFVTQITSLLMLMLSCAHIDEQKTIAATSRTDREVRIIDSSQTFEATGTARPDGNLSISVFHGNRCEFTETTYTHRVERVIRTNGGGFGPIGLMVSGLVLGGGLGGYGVYEFARSSSIPEPGPRTGTTDPNAVRTTGMLFMAGGAAVLAIATAMAVFTGIKLTDSETDLGETRAPTTVTQKLCSPIPLSNSKIVAVGPSGAEERITTSNEGSFEYLLLDATAAHILKLQQDRLMIRIGDRPVRVDVDTDVWAQITEILRKNLYSGIAKEAAARAVAEATERELIERQRSEAAVAALQKSCERVAAKILESPTTKYLKNQATRRSEPEITARSIENLEEGSAVRVIALGKSWAAIQQTQSEISWLPTSELASSQEIIALAQRRIASAKATRDTTDAISLVSRLKDSMPPEFEKKLRDLDEQINAIDEMERVRSQSKFDTTTPTPSTKRTKGNREPRDDSAWDPAQCSEQTQPMCLELCQSFIKLELQIAAVCVRKCPTSYRESPCGGGAVCGSSTRDADCIDECMSKRTQRFRNCFRALGGSW